MADLSYEFEGSIWLYTGKAAWHFVSVPEHISQHIKTFAGQAKAGFGSIRVHALIGDTSWNTSIFPDSKANCYQLPIKGAVRKAENLGAHDRVYVVLELDIEH